MPEIFPLLKKQDIDNMVSSLAQRISDDYRGRKLVLVGILKGSFVFLSDLMRRLTIPVQVDFIGASSYGSSTSTSGNIHLTKKLEIDVKDKDVLIVEDIVDTGLTLSHIIEHIKSFTPKTVKICTLLDKPERREAKINIDYSCHVVVQKGFLVGYGLDYAEDYRNLPEICRLKF